MKEKHELENQILGIFQEKGKGANKIVLQMLTPTTALKKRAVIRNILSRIYINNDGTYFLKPFLNE